MATLAIGLIGTAISAVGTLAAGAQAKAGAEFQAAQLDQQAAEEKAAAQREAMQVRKERDFVLSRQQAVAAGSNLGALDETVMDLAGDVTQQAAYQEAMVMYGGESRARGRRMQAASARLEGKAAQTGAMFSAAGTLAKGIGSFAADWGARPAATPAYVSARYQDPWLGYR